MSAIILDGHLKSALATVRSLGSAGISFRVGAVRDSGMALHSRCVTKKFTYPSPYTDVESFIEVLKREAQELGDMPVLYMFSDATYLSVYAHREELSPYLTLVFPEATSVEIAFNKAATYSLAKVSGVDTIPTFMPESSTEVEYLSTLLTYPAVLKTRRSVTWNKGLGVFGSAEFIVDAPSLQKSFLQVKEAVGEAPLVQTFLRGEEYGVEMLALKGKVIGEVTHHRIRSLRPTGGASVLKETLQSGDLKSALESYAHILVEKLSWTGPIMVEFKVDSDTREPKLMEINGRFWGSLPLSIAAGVDMPVLYYKLARAEELPEEKVTARDGVVTNHFLGDVFHLMQVLCKRDPMRKILYPTRLQALKDFCFPPSGARDDVWLWRDPMPTCMEVFDTLKKTFL